MRHIASVANFTSIGKNELLFSSNSFFSILFQLVFAVGWSRSVSVHFLTTDCRSILTDWSKKTTEKRPKFDFLRNFCEIAEFFRQFHEKMVKFRPNFRPKSRPRSGRFETTAVEVDAVDFCRPTANTSLWEYFGFGSGFRVLVNPILKFIKMRGKKRYMILKSISFLRWKTI